MATLTELSSESNADKFLMGNSLFTGLKLGKVRTLFGEVNGANKYASLREYSTGAGYIVPAGKVFVMVYFTYVLVSGGSSGSYASFGSGTTDVGMNSSSAPSGKDTDDSRTAVLQTASTMDVAKTWLAKFKAGYYPFVFSSAGAGGVHVIGYEINEDDESL